LTIEGGGKKKPRVKITPDPAGWEVWGKGKEEV
jgi:hypothetical protein